MFNVAVLIPCLNEQKTIYSVIKEIKKKLPKAKIYLFDNNSIDESKKMAKKAGAITFDVTTQGKGFVVRRMFSDVDADVYVMIDGDKTYDISNIQKMIDMLINNKLDMVVAKRISHDKKAYRFGHQIGNRLFSYLVKFIFGDKINDLFSGFRIFSKRFVKSFPCHSIGFEIETELTIHALEQKLSVEEIECKYFSRPKGSESKLKTYEDGFKILNLILILLKDEKPLFFFFIFSFIFLTISLSLGIPVVFDFFEKGTVEKLPTAILSGLIMIIAFLCFFSGLILDSLKKIRHEQKRLQYLKFN